MFSFFTLQIIVVFYVCDLQAEDVNGSYTNVVRQGVNVGNESTSIYTGPNIFKALHTNLNSLNLSTENIDGLTEGQRADTSSGRAYTYSDSYHSYPSRYMTKQSRWPSVIYPQRRPSYTRIGGPISRLQASDRYTPGEAVATNLFKKKNKGYQYNRPKMTNSRPSGVGYVPPKDLYAFPPNLDSNYLPPSKPVANKPRKPITSYIPPPAGVPDLGFVGPVNPEYLPPFMKDSKPPNDMGNEHKPDGIAETPMDSEIPPGDTLPPFKDADNSNDPPKPEEGAHSHEDMPHTNDDSESKGALMDDEMMEHDESSDMKLKPMDMDHHANTDSEMPDDAFLYHGSHPPFGSHGVDAYPEIIFDDHDHSPDHDHSSDHDHDHDHHHYHHTHPPEIMMTTSKPEPPPEPRVKKYSYYYLSRKIWYIPLYFTVWFSFYILWLIIKSIARHKVNLPNHYTSRMMKRSLPDYFLCQENVHHLNDLTELIMSYIDGFEEKYSATNNS